jgi:hypothetical protein
MFIPERSILTSAPGVHKVSIAEKINTSEGWTTPSPDENWTRGFPQEFSDFINSIVNDKEPICGLELGVDTVAAMYSAYLSNELKGAEVDIPQINV